MFLSFKILQKKKKYFDQKIVRLKFQAFNQKKISPQIYFYFLNFLNY